MPTRLEQDWLVEKTALRCFAQVYLGPLKKWAMKSIGSRWNLETTII
jgi:hypothetical protein